VKNEKVKLAYHESVPRHGGKEMIEQIVET